MLERERDFKAEETPSVSYSFSEKCLHFQFHCRERSCRHKKMVNNGKERRRVQGMKKKAEELSILCNVETCLILTDPSSSSSSPSSSSLSSLCYSWPEDLHTCISSLQRYRNFNHQKAMMITQKKRKIDCLSSSVLSIDEKFKKPKFDSSLSTDFCTGFDDDVQLLLSMIDSEQKSVKDQIRLSTENQPKQAEVVVVEQSDEISNSEYHCERKDFDDSEMISEMGNLDSADLCDGFDDELLFVLPEVDFTQIQLLDDNQKEARDQDEQSDEIFGCEGKKFEDFEMINEMLTKTGHLISADLCDGFEVVDPTQIQLFTDKAHDQVEILGCEEKQDSEVSEMMINELISEYLYLNDMDYRNYMGNDLVNFEQDFQGIPVTTDDYLMQSNCIFSGTYPTLNDSWQKSPLLSTV